MQKVDDELVYAPTDLSRWVDSRYASWMARYAAECPDQAPSKDEADAMLERLAGRGLAHEDALEEQFRAEGREVVNIVAMMQSQAGVFATHAARQKAALAMTLEKLRAGVDVVAQATLQHGGFRGHADFLVKVPGPSAFGAFHYEVRDAKLARRVKPGMVLQLCCYVDMLDAIQQCRAEHIVVALGNGTTERVPLIACFDYYLAVRHAFLLDQADWREADVPDPAEYASHGDWSTHAAAVLEASDHPARVARITRQQIKHLNTAGITTMTALADSASLQVPGISAGKFDWLVRQAALQCASAGRDVPEFQLLDRPGNDQRHGSDKQGLGALPDACPLDVFFDIEGFALEGEGLEYLWGCTYLDDEGQQAFRDWWAHDTHAERGAFEAFIDWVHARWQTDPAMHIYHYAPYEITACKRLAGRHATRETELDELLRNGVFVDLYAIVTHGLQVGEPRYSIKNVERLYRGKRATEVASGGDSVVVYDLWREAFARGEASDDWRQCDVLQEIRDYNRDDCDSTLELCHWLRKHRTVGDQGVPIEVQERVEPELSDVVVARQALRDELLLRAGTVAEAADRDLLETLAGVLEFHRREEKSVWWRFFERMDPMNTALADDSACLANCRRSRREPYKLTPGTKKLAYAFSFDPRQEWKGIARNVYLKAGPTEAGQLPARAEVLHAESDLAAGRIVLKCTIAPPDVVSLIPDEIVHADPIPAAIDAVVARIAAGEADSAIVDFLERRPPRIEAWPGGPIVNGAGSNGQLEKTVEAVRHLDNSCLVIQGPPGCGKSWMGARLIANLLEDGCRIGIASNSHAAINNLLIGTAAHCASEGIEASFVCTKHTDDALDDLAVTITTNKKLIDHVEPACVIGTTAWGFARDELAGALDVLFVDEAGQVALANLVAMSRSARNLVLMGDQRQLGQPTQGVHPADSGLSALDYRLGTAATIDACHGVFLGTTWRMHPAINDVISRHVYEGRLETAAVTAQRSIKPGPAPFDKPAGIVHLPVEHAGNQQASDEEVAAIVEAVATLTGCRLISADGTDRRITPKDMLFVAPYNAQVKRLQMALGPEARVGSVDRFQGQEAPIVFLSLCSSDAAESPRGPGFLFDANRLNVAVSRAQTLCVVVGHPGLAVTPVATLADLKRVNFVAALMHGSPSVTEAEQLLRDRTAASRCSKLFDMIAIDLDGTLADTISDLHAALVLAQQSLGMPVSSEQSVRDWVGNGIESLVHRGLTGSMHGKAEPALFARALGLFQAAYDEVNGSAARLYPGVRAGLGWLSSLQVPLVCVTNKAGRYSRPLLDKLDIAHRFAHHIAGDDVAAKKPDPEALFEAARRCGAAPARCLLIGDSISDIRAARAAGFACVCVSYGYNHGQSVREQSGAWQPDAVIDSFSELPNVLPRLAADN